MLTCQKGLLESFKQFFERGSVEDCLKFIHLILSLIQPKNISATAPPIPLQLIAAPSSLSSIADLLTTPPPTITPPSTIPPSTTPPSTTPPSITPSSATPLSTTLPSIAPPLNTYTVASNIPPALSSTAPLSSTLLSTTSLSTTLSTIPWITSYYQKEGINQPTQLRRLVKATQGLIFAKPIGFESYRQLWKGAIVAGSLRTDINHYDCARRLSLLFIAQAIDQEELIGNLDVSSGKGRKTAAFNKIAKKKDIGELDVRKYYRMSRNYRYLMDIGGLGSLLEIGNEASLCVNANF